MSVWVESVQGGQGHVGVGGVSPRWIGSCRCGWSQSEVGRVMCRCWWGQSKVGRVMSVWEGSGQGG